MKEYTGFVLFVIAVCYNSSDYLFPVSQGNKSKMAQNKDEKKRHIVSCIIILYLLPLKMKKKEKE